MSHYFFPSDVLGMCRSIIHLVYIMDGYFAMVSSHVFNVSMLNRSFPAPSLFFVSTNAASTADAIIGGTSSGSVCIVMAWSLSYNSEYN